MAKPVMQLLLNYIYYLMCFFWGLTLFGLYRPWYALWWADVSNRKKVLVYYGTTSLLLTGLYLILRE